MKTSLFSTTSRGLPILGYFFENKGPEILILGGVHGDEPEGVTAAWGLLKILMQNFNYKLNLTLVPEFNLDGIIDKTRMNANGVDLNRNLPTKDWSPEAKTVRYNPGPKPLSEPENQGLVQFLQSRNVKMITSLHSWEPMINVNGPCLEEAQVLSNITGYKIDTDIGYPTPGSLGTYAGLEKNLPTITYEIQRDMNLKEVVETHVPALLEMLKVCEAKYAP
ncbi:MAG: M14 family zinc carboxypeptidase [Bdellovibrionota bacterium]